MNTRWVYAISLVVGVICGLISNVGFLRNSWTDLILWGAAGFALGFIVTGKWQIIGAGSIYGVSVAVAFLASAFGGTPEKIPGYLVLTLLLSIAAGLGGIADVFVASRVNKLVTRS